MMLNLKRMIAVVLSVACLFAFSACEIMSPRNPQPSPSVELLDESDNQMDQNTDNIKENSDDGSATPDDERDNTEDSPNSDSVKEYFPIYMDTRLVYEGEGNEYAYFNVYTDYASESLVQQRIDNGGTQTVRVIEIDDNAIVQKLFRGEVYYRENLLRLASTAGGISVADDGTNADILLKVPIKVGNQWTLADGSTRSITNVDAEVETLHGNRKAVEVTTVGKHGTTLDYYSEGIGLVKTIYRTEGSEVSSTLSQIEEGVPFVQLVNFYFPSVDDSDAIYYVSREVPYYTNDITRIKLETEYRDAYDQGGEKISTVFSENTKINSLYLNEDGMVYIDLSGDYLTEMNAGAGYESAMLQCIANTFGGYYNVERVYITIDGELYSSGHISLEKGEYIEVKIEDAKSVKM